MCSIHISIRRASVTIRIRFHGDRDEEPASVSPCVVDSVAQCYSVAQCLPPRIPRGLLKRLNVSRSSETLSSNVEIL